MTQVLSQALMPPRSPLFVAHVSAQSNGLQGRALAAKGAKSARRQEKSGNNIHRKEVTRGGEEASRGAGGEEETAGPGYSRYKMSVWLSVRWQMFTHLSR